MKLDRYECSNGGRRRLSGSLQKRGAKMGMGTWVAFLFGTPFVGAGVAIILMGTRILRVDPASVHAPYWVLTAAGACFVLGGLAVWGAAGRQLAVNRRRRKAMREHPNEPAFADYEWDPKGFEVSGWPGAAKVMGLAMGLTLFLSIFNYWAFVKGDGWVPKLVVAIFDGVGVLMWWQACQAIGSAFKFGRSRIMFTRFPYNVAEPVVIRWQPSEGISEMNRGSFTLRCVEEWTETTGSGKSRAVQLVHEELWSAQWMLGQPRKLPLKDVVELSYDLPAGAPPTRLSADRPVFWELEVSLDLPGLDFKQSYLVPIYDGKPKGSLKPTMLHRAAPAGIGKECV
jgi:hypothetical protein